MNRKRKALVTKLSVQGAPELRKTDNLAVWVNGNGTEYDEDSLRAAIRNTERSFNNRIHELEDGANSFHQKPKRKGKLYWYRWIGRWKYIGPVGKEDPRQGFLNDVAMVKVNRTIRIAKMRDCVVKELGNHLLINMDEWIKVGTTPKDLIRVKDVLT